MGIKKKLILGIVLLISLNFISEFISERQDNEVQKSVKQLTLMNEKKDLLNNFLSILTNNTLGYMDAIVDKDTFKVVVEIKNKHTGIKEWYASNNEKLKNYFINTNLKYEEFDKAFNLYWSLGEAMLKDIEAHKIDTLDKYDDQIDDNNHFLQNNTFELIKLAEINFTNAKNNLERIQKLKDLIATINIVISFIIGLSVAYYLLISIRSALVDTQTKIADSSTNILKTSHVFNKLGQELSSSMNHQAQALQETVAAVEEINMMIAKNAEGANLSSTLSDNCVQSAYRGKESINEMVNSVDDLDNNQKEILEVLSSTNNQITELVDVIKNISEKTHVINDIVFQTKLLSFNASVEAARAGENGKGFAVVAEEVGNLAGLSGNAAKEINDLLKSSVEQVEKIVANSKRNIKEITDKGEQSIKSSTITAKRCETALEEIIVEVDNMKSMVANIAMASNEQSLGIKEITKALLEIDKLTTQNSEMSKECAKEANHLLGQSMGLEKTVTDLKVAIDG
jgi:methyl-accepting chemotaxis protein